MQPRTCFSREQLSDYLLGRLGEELSDEVAVHIEQCADCEITVAELDHRGDTLIEGLKANVAAASESRSDLSAALARVRDLDVLVAAGSVAADEPSPLGAVRDYELHELLGRGGMGAVYRARHRLLQRAVAVKLLPLRRLSSPEAMARFRREMQTIGQLRHPAVVQATDAGEVDGVQFLAMELIDGLDLNRLVRSCGPLPVADACQLALQAARGLDYVHQQGIVHRDIKPSNLMLGRDGQVRILDLGLALLSGIEGPVDELTTIGQLMGTLDYMAPEQCENSHSVDPRADIYSLGATLYRLLTGLPPYGDDRWKSPLQKLKAMAAEPPPSVLARRADLPAELAAMVDRCLAREPDQRFGTMTEFACQIEPLAEGSDLVRLAERAAAATAADESQPDSAIASCVAAQGQQGADEKLIEQAANRLTPHAKPASHRGRRWAWVVSALALVVMAILGVLIVIESGKGQLVIEASQPDIEVRIVKSGRTVQQLELTHGQQSTRLMAGDYAIEIISPTDSLVVRNGVFTLQRGAMWVARIEEKPAAAAAASQVGPSINATTTAAQQIEPGGQIQFDGKTFDQWVAVLKSERSPDRIGPALEAIGRLAEGPLMIRAATEIVQAFRIHDCEESYPPGSGLRNKQLSASASEALNRIPVETRRSALLNELKVGTIASKRFALTHLLDAFVYSWGISNLMRDLPRNTPELFTREMVDELIALSNDQSSDSAKMAFLVIACLLDDDLDTQLSQPIIQRLRTAAIGTDPGYAMAGLLGLARVESQAAFVVSTVSKRLEDGPPEDKVYAASVLCQFASRASEAVPILTRIFADHGTENYRIIYAPSGWQPRSRSHLLMFGTRSFQSMCVLDAAGYALGEIGVSSPEIIEALQAELDRRLQWDREIRTSLGNRFSTSDYDKERSKRYPAGPRVPHSYSNDPIERALSRLAPLQTSRPPRNARAAPFTPLTPAAPKPQYEGKDLAEWLQVLRTERSPSRVATALEAIEHLVQDAEAKVAAQEIVRLFRIHDPDALYSVGEKGGQQYLSNSAVQVLDKIAPTACAAALLEELQQGTPQSKRFAVRYLLLAADKRPSDRPALFLAEITDILLRESRGEPSPLRLLAFRVLARLVVIGELDSRLKERLIDSLDKDEPDYAYVTLSNLALIEGELEFVLNQATKRLAKGSAAEQVVAGWVLSELKEAAIPAVPALLRVLESDCVETYAAVTNVSIRFSMAGGGFGGGELPKLYFSWDRLPSNHQSTCARDLAVIALAEIGDRSPEVIAGLKAELEKRKDWPEPVVQSPFYQYFYYSRKQTGTATDRKYPAPEVPATYSARLVQQALQRLQ